MLPEGLPIREGNPGDNQRPSDRLPLANAEGGKRQLIMERANFASPANLSLIEDYYERWKKDPSSVDASWRIFFEGFDLGREPNATASDPIDLDAARAGRPSRG